MTYIIDYFDLNKRTSMLQQTSDESIDDQLVSAVKSELKLDIPQPPTALPENQTKVKQSTFAGFDDEDHLFNDMSDYWSNHDRRAEEDRRNAIRRKFSFGQNLLSNKTKPKSSIAWWQQLTLYSGIILGAILSSTVIEHQLGTQYTFNISVLTVFLASTMAIIISPVAFEMLHMNNSGPFFIRLFLFIQNGVFWCVLLSAFSLTLVQLFAIGFG